MPYVLSVFKIALLTAELMSLATSGLRFDAVELLFVLRHKPETIDTLKHNIREAIFEIQLHTIDNVRNVS